MADRKIWIYAATAGLVALAVGFGAAWALQAQKVSDAKAELALADAKRSSLETELTSATAALKDTEARLAAQAASAAVPATATAPSTAPSTSKPTGFSGKQFGFIKKVETKGGKTYVTFDLAQFLTGEAAAEAATAHGDESPPPNDYYIVNDSKKLRSYRVAKSVTVRFTTAPDDIEPEGYTSTLATLIDVFAGASSGMEGAKTSPYWLTLKNGTVTRIEEQYLP